MIYLDSCIVIYAVEADDKTGEKVRAKLAQTDEVIATSPLVLHECLVGPLRDTDWELRDRYVAVYSQFKQLDLGLETFMRAAELRAASQMKTPDSIHVAAAQIAGCTEFWTNDHRLMKSTRGLGINILE
ncbi:type II toxin-antitoxin system VapC family toxin [Ancrocorticia populi]|uniref:Ribonuclease VapC n=1 Tax=Ancrocorticia populi TaxID=2175228 RepID=A0A2V1KDA8_9ACTO|nr:PIN domain-containing protein [Ancrocorticia populi]PWF27631.1 hypothetical protein DD236_04445 [Ancrocorticia populi]